MEDIGKQILEFRGTHSPRLSRAQFAKMCGVTAQTVYNIETGRCEPSMAVAASIRKVLDKRGYESELLSVRQQEKCGGNDYWEDWLNGTTDIL